MMTSLHVFCGDYITEQEAQEISDRYWYITRALELVNFPLAVPGTKVYKATQARKAAVKIFEACVKQSKERMKTGAEPLCLLDEWNQNLFETNQGDEKYSDTEQALVIFSFIFASQGKHRFASIVARYN